MPDEPPRDEEADFLDFLKDDDSEKEPPEPPKGEEGDLVVLGHGAGPGEGSDEFREAEQVPPEIDEDAPGEDFRDQTPEPENVPSAEEAGSDELLGWLDDAAKDSLEDKPVEELMTQEMTGSDDPLPGLSAGDDDEEPVEAEAVTDEEIGAEVDLVFGEEPRAVAPEKPAYAESAETDRFPAIEEEPEAQPALKKQSFDDFRSQSSEPAEEVVEEASAEFDAFLSEEEAPAPQPPAREKAPAEPVAAGASGKALFRLENGTPIPTLPSSLGGYSPPSDLEFGKRKISYPVVRTPLPLAPIILILLIIVAAGAGYHFRDEIKAQTVVWWEKITGPVIVQPVQPVTGTGTATPGDVEKPEKPEDVEKPEEPERVTPSGLYTVMLNGVEYTFVKDDEMVVRDFVSFIQDMQNVGFSGKK